MRNVIDGDWPRLRQIVTKIFRSFDFFKPKRISALAQPELESGELAIWRDSGTNTVYLLYNDPDEGHVKVELS